MIRVRIEADTEREILKWAKDHRLTTPKIYSKLDGKGYFGYCQERPITQTPLKQYLT